MRLCVPLDTNVCNREVVGQKCDVTNWDSQLALFELGISSFGAIDVVVRTSHVETDVSSSILMIGGKRWYHRNWCFLRVSSDGRQT